MFPRLSTVFASRWNALWFAGMTLLLAYCAVPGEPPAAADSATATADAKRAIADSKLTAEERAQAEQAIKALEDIGKQ